MVRSSTLSIQLNLNLACVSTARDESIAPKGLPEAVSTKLACLPRSSYSPYPRTQTQPIPANALNNAVVPACIVQRYGPTVVLSASNKKSAHEELENSVRTIECFTSASSRIIFTTQNFAVNHRASQFASPVQDALHAATKGRKGNSFNSGSHRATTGWRRIDRPWGHNLSRTRSS